MSIGKYMDVFDVSGKCFLLMAVTPIGEYPSKSYGKEFDTYAKNVIPKEKYIGLFDPKRNEILQDVAFRLYTLPLIGDRYDIHNSNVRPNARANKESVVAYFAIKEYMDTVPYGDKTEDESITDGIKKGNSFLEKYPLDQFEIVITKHSRNEDGCQYLTDMEFDDENPNYHFNRVYVY